MPIVSHIVWNLFLAFVPVVLAFAISAGIRQRREAGRARLSGWWLIPAALWLAFLPNTCYLVTEWRHYLSLLVSRPDLYWGARQGSVAFMGYMAFSACYVLYSGLGILAFCLAVWPLDRLFRPPWPARALFFAACSLGVYLGLIRRFNSWDLLSRPGEVAATVGHSLLNSGLVAVMSAFALFLWAVYLAFGIFMDGLEHRRRCAPSTPAPGATQSAGRVAKLDTPAPPRKRRKESRARRA